MSDLTTRNKNARQIQRDANLMKFVRISTEFKNRLPFLHVIVDSNNDGFIPLIYKKISD